MSDAPADRAQVLLAELAELDMALARKVHAAAMAAEEPQALADLARGYQRLARSARQTLALAAKLDLDRAKHERGVQSMNLHEAVHYYGLRPGQLPPSPITSAPDPAGPDAAARKQRASDLHTALTRVAWDEAERPEGGRDLAGFDGNLDLIDQLVSDQSLAESFCDEPLDGHVRRLGRILSLPARALARWRELPDAPPNAMSSAMSSAVPVLPDAPWRHSG